ncbi:hypothetical protein SNOG_14916 [Parastagonospora nodorum SN15]|uniref:Uncharacterized protein n=1 Tax=Phaeosphaeria nodorum (strain SN15 / ATCC MYA-4574 / FGSC 10173) TaxID=321614 RepID=Q0U065_PHANO|nr:hypothetical protein SNOG_14916 [Parastagonospora nodorum SN15]EAT77768.1 hypothetical protein SNOG_14916 [Parastagonospora nodorum SN15]
MYKFHAQTICARVPYPAPILVRRFWNNEEVPEG